MVMKLKKFRRRIEIAENMMGAPLTWAWLL
jgi:hypothetical protein